MLNLSEADMWGELRSLVERAMGEPERVDAVVLWLGLWQARFEASRYGAVRYATQKLQHTPCGEHVTVGEIIAWCFEGHEALRGQMERFHRVSDAGCERWLAVLSWAIVVSQLEGVPLEHVQVTASVRVSGDLMRQLYMMASHDEHVYVLDVHQGPQHLCMGIVGRTRWPGFEPMLHELAWGEGSGAHGVFI